MKSILGPLRIRRTGSILHGLRLPPSPPRRAIGVRGRRSWTAILGLEHLRLDFAGFSPFSRKVWRAAGKIPFGETRTYGWIARKVGKP
ncbi:MAG: MGMT family protein [Candidatus Aureabacteria bacterium]|nr:MGMT family protein [Candidatus Auribacterota bacterium]